SHARTKLVQALVSRPARHLFAVGDDWQSIYRFAGSDIHAMTQFEETFGTSQTLYLERTFRNSQQLSTIASDFVMKNPNQLRKRVHSDDELFQPVKLALASSNADVTHLVDR